MYLVVLLVKFVLDAFKLVDIINENNLKDLYLFNTVIMQAVPQGNSGLFSEPHLPPEGIVLTNIILELICTP